MFWKIHSIIKLTFPPQDSSNNKAAEEKLSDHGTDEEAGGAEQREEAQQEVQLQDEDKPQQEVKTEEEELINQVEKQQGQQIPEAPAAEHGQDHKVPVHQGQPEMWTHKLWTARFLLKKYQNSTERTSESLSLQMIFISITILDYTF